MLNRRAETRAKDTWRRPAILDPIPTIPTPYPQIAASCKCWRKRRASSALTARNGQASVSSPQQPPRQTAHNTHTTHDTRQRTHDTRHTTHDTRHTTRVTRDTKRGTRHTAHDTRHTPHATRHTPHATRHTAYDSSRTDNNDARGVDRALARPVQEDVHDGVRRDSGRCGAAAAPAQGCKRRRLRR